MTRSIAPGQTVPVPFTLSETPDSTPTLTVYQSTAAGVLSDVSATTSPTVTLLGSGLEYHAYYTVPAAALHGSSYQLLVSVTISSETTTHWLDGGTVELWASQSSVDALAGDVEALTTNSGVASTAPARRAGNRVEVEIVRGDTYEDGLANGALDFDEQDWWPSDLTGATITLTARVKRGRHYTTDPAVVLTKSGTVVAATTPQQVRVELTATETAAATVGTHEYDVQATLSTGEVVTLVGPGWPFRVVPDQSLPAS